MNRMPRVLIVDDLQKWQEQLVNILNRNGFYADSAPTADQALKRLEEELFHVLVLDIRMNDADHTNVDGIEMLTRLKERHWNDTVKVIMLSAYGTQEQMRTAFKDYDVADFVSKDHLNNPSFLDNVRQVFEQEMEINLSLEIQWEQVAGPEQVIPQPEGNGNAGKQGAAFRKRMAVELDDLLCRLFSNAQCIVVKPFIPGHSGSGVLRALPFYASAGGGHPWVVKFGNLQAILQEHRNFETFVAPFVGGGRSTTVLGMRCTPHLGGIIYSQLGATSEHVESLGHFYQRTDEPAIREVINRLFLQTCSQWYASPGFSRPYNLTHNYQRLLGYTQRELEQAVMQLKSVQGRERLFFVRLNSVRNFTNPLRSIEHEPFIRTTYECFTHGDFNPDNILVDESRNSWLIDFQSTGPGHILRDIATLDAVVRFQLLTSEEATLDERLTMEDALYSIDRFSQVEQLMTLFSTQNRALEKAYATVVHLRTIAHRLVELSANDRLGEYYIALLYIALDTLRYSTLPEIQREHALLSASLLVDRLERSENNP